MIPRLYFEKFFQKNRNIYQNLQIFLKKFLPMIQAILNNENCIQTCGNAKAKSKLGKNPITTGFFDVLSCEIVK